MKLLPSLLFLAAVTLPGYAQIPRGTTYAGVSVTNAFTYAGPNRRADHNSYGFTLQPGFGWFIIDNLSIGMQVDAYAGTFTDTSSWLSSHPYSLGGSVFVRDYLPITQKIYALVTLDCGWQRGRTGYEYENRNLSGAPTDHGTYDCAANTFGARAGTSWFMTPHLTLEGTLGYTRRNHRDLDAHTHLPFRGMALEISLRRWNFRQ